MNTSIIRHDSEWYHPAPELPERGIVVSFVRTEDGDMVEYVSHAGGGCITPDQAIARGLLVPCPAPDGPDAYGDMMRHGADMPGPRGPVNSHEWWARAVKAHRLAVLMENAIRHASFDNPDLVAPMLEALHECDAEARHTYAAAAGTTDPSLTTWELAVAMVERTVHQ